MKMHVPCSMKAVILKTYEPDLKKAVKNLQIEERAVPKPSKAQVLIRVEAAAINPADLSFIQGLYGARPKLPVIPGFEGTGTVVEAGESSLAQGLIGKRVFFAAMNTHDGTWTEYATTDAFSCFNLRLNVPPEQAAGLIVNPFTAFGLLQTAKDNGSKAIIQTAAAGQLGHMLAKIAGMNSMKVINVVRDKRQKKMMLDEGEKYVIDSSERDFEDQIKKLARRLRATTLVDSVSGDLPGKIFNVMPDSSKMIVYGALSGQGLENVDPRELIFKGKKIVGFILGEWLANLETSKMMEITSEIQNLFASKQLETKINKIISLDEISEGILTYANNMTKGKVVLMP